MKKYDEKWKVAAYNANGDIFEMSFDTSEAAKEMYEMLTADNQYVSFRMESPHLRVVD